MAVTTTPELHFHPYDVDITADPYPVLGRLRYGNREPIAGRYVARDAELHEFSASTRRSSGSSGQSSFRVYAKTNLRLLPRIAG